MQLINVMSAPNLTFNRSNKSNWLINLFFKENPPSECLHQAKIVISYFYIAIFLFLYCKRHIVKKSHVNHTQLHVHSWNYSLTLWGFALHLHGHISVATNRNIKIYI